MQPAQPSTTNERIVDPASEYAPAPEWTDNPLYEGGEREKTRVIFVPWEEGTPQAEEWKHKSEQWNTAKKNKQFDIVYYRHGGEPSDALLRATADPNGVVYVRGHGSPGAKGLVTKFDGDKSEMLPMTDVCERLVEMGLGKQFQGAVKFHSCYSGTIHTEEQYDLRQTETDKRVAMAKGLVKDNTQGLWSRLREGEDAAKAQQVTAGKKWIAQQELHRPTRESLATQGANALRGKGLKHCTYFGYLGPVESEYGKMDTSPTGGEVWHKFVDLEGLHAPAILQGINGNPRAVRASVARVRIK